MMASNQIITFYNSIDNLHKPALTMRSLMLTTDARHWTRNICPILNERHTANLLNSITGHCIMGMHAKRIVIGYLINDVPAWYLPGT